MTDLSLLRTAWTETLARGDKPDGDALRAHLRAVHRDNAGFTEACARRCRDARGRTSYEWLAEAVNPDRHRSVLDLACGSGPLLEIFHGGPGRNLRLIGVDMCPEELALARARLPDSVVELLQAEAQSLTALPDGSVDVALCHWALTLMDPVAPVLHELRRVLVPGGRFAALVDGPMDTAPGYRETHDLIYDHVRAELPGYGEVDLGDPRIRGTESLVALVHEAFPGARVSVEQGVVTMDGPADSIAAEASGFFYAAFVLSPARRVRMLADLAAALAGRSPDGPARFAMPVNRLVVDLP